MATQTDEEISVKNTNEQIETECTTKSDQSDETASQSKKIKTENGKVKEEGDESSKKEVLSTNENTNTTTNNEEDDEESLKDELEDDEQQGALSMGANVGKKSFLGHTCSVKTLIDDNVLIPENNALSFEFMVSFYCY